MDKLLIMQNPFPFEESGYLIMGRVAQAANGYYNPILGLSLALYSAANCNNDAALFQLPLPNMGA